METIYKKAHTDIDIDVLNSKEVIEALPCIRSTEVITSEGFIPHKSGIHFDDIPHDPVTGYASITYKEAEEMGYQKVDILSQSAYKYVRDREHLLSLSKIEPDWDLFLEPTITKQLSQLREHSTLLSIWKPRSIEELAMILAMIRPAKMQCKTMNDWDEVRKTIWDYDSVGYNASGQKLRYYKKSHAFAYSLMIVIQLNALVEHIMSDAF